MAYWVCFLSNNQWHVSQEVGDGNWKSSSFYKTLTSGICHGTCMVLDADALPLTRSWCLFEVLQTYRLVHHQGAGGVFDGLKFCTSRGVLGCTDQCFDISIALGRRLATLSVADATATVKEDQDMIVRLVEEDGGMENMNKFIRCNMRDTLDQVEKEFVGYSSALRQRLSNNDKESVETLESLETVVLDLSPGVVSLDDETVALDVSPGVASSLDDATPPAEPAAATIAVFEAGRTLTAS